MDYMCIHFSYMCVSIYTNVHETMYWSICMYAFSRYGWMHTVSHTYIHKSIYSYIDVYMYPDIRTDVNIGAQIYLYIYVQAS